MDRGGWRATVHGVEKNRKWLSMRVCMQGEGATQKTHLAEGFQGRGFKGNIWGKIIIIIKRRRLSVYVQTWPRRERQHLEDEVGEINKMN